MGTKNSNTSQELFNLNGKPSFGQALPLAFHTDSLDYDRLYEMANFFDGGTLIDGKDKLVSDWGERSEEHTS